MGNPFGITVDPVWAKWAAESGVSETTAAALFLLSKKRKAEEVVDRLKPDELKVVVEVVENSPECFPQGTLTAFQDSRPDFQDSRPEAPRRSARNPYGIELDDEALRCAAAEGVPASVIAAICLLHDGTSVDQIVARLTTAELEMVIKIAGRSPQIYPPGAYDALKEERVRRFTQGGGSVASSVAPEVLEARGRQLGVAHGS
jgi:hypothetical protein